MTMTSLSSIVRRGSARASHGRRVAVALAAVVTAVLVAAGQVAPAAAAQGRVGASAARVGAPYTETYRPQFHFTPGAELDERPQRADLLPGRVPPVLPVQPVGQHVGQHLLGPRGQPGSGALAASCRWRSPRDDQNYASRAVRSSTTSNTSGFGRPGEPGDGRDLHRHRQSHQHAAPGAGLQPRQRPHLHQVRHRARHRLHELPRPQGVLVRPGTRVADDRGAVGPAQGHLLHAPRTSSTGRT